jgi:hypothetical protein
MNAIAVGLLSNGFKVAGTAIGEKLGSYVVPSLVAPAARSFVGWSIGPTTGFFAAITAHIAKEEAGFIAFQTARGVAPIAGAALGGVAGTVLFNSLSLAAGYSCSYAYDLYRSRERSIEKNTTEQAIFKHKALRLKA